MEETSPRRCHWQNPLREHRPQRRPGDAEKTWEKVVAWISLTPALRVPVPKAGEGEDGHLAISKQGKMPNTMLVMGDHEEHPQSSREKDAQGRALSSKRGCSLRVSSCKTLSGPISSPQPSTRA